MGLALPGWDGLIQAAASTSRSIESLAVAGLVVELDIGMVPARAVHNASRIVGEVPFCHQMSKLNLGIGR